MTWSLGRYLCPFILLYDAVEFHKTDKDMCIFMYLAIWFFLIVMDIVSLALWNITALCNEAEIPFHSSLPIAVYMPDSGLWIDENQRNHNGKWTQGMWCLMSQLLHSICPSTDARTTMKWIGLGPERTHCCRSHPPQPCHFPKAWHTRDKDTTALLLNLGSHCNISNKTAKQRIIRVST